MRLAKSKIPHFRHSFIKTKVAFVKFHNWTFVSQTPHSPLFSSLCALFLFYRQKHCLLKASILHFISSLLIKNSYLIFSGLFSGPIPPQNFLDSALSREFILILCVRRIRGPNPNLKIIWSLENVRVYIYFIHFKPTTRSPSCINIETSLSSHRILWAIKMVKCQKFTREDNKNYSCL